MDFSFAPVRAQNLQGVKKILVTDSGGCIILMPLMFYIYVL